MARKTGLGKGLGAFFGDDVVEQELENKKDTVGKVRKEAAEKAAQKEASEKSESGEKSSTKTGRAKTNTSKTNTTKSKAEKPAIKEVVKEVEVIKEVEVVKTVEVEKQKYLPVSMIEQNIKQPRKDFKEAELAELAESIKQYGVISPIVVQETAENSGIYKIIAGERRFRAAKMAGLTEVPVSVKNITEQEAMEIALIENVQRLDLNPIEEAKAYQMLIDEYDLTQDEVAQKVSKSRTVITNTMRLLKLTEKIQNMLMEGTISSGHARALITIENPDIQNKIAEKIVAEGLSVREVEKLVKNLDRKPREKKEKDTSLDIYFQNVEEDLKTIFGTKVNINKRDNNKGKIEIEYYSSEELNRLIDIMKKLKAEEEIIG